MKKKIFAIILAVSMVLFSGAWALAEDTLPTIDEGHIILRSGNNGLQITEFIKIVNQDGKPFTGGVVTDSSGKQRNGWLIPLPQGFQNLQVQGWSTDAYAAGKDGIQIYQALNAGQTNQFSFTYDIPVSELPVTISKKIVFPSKQFSLIAPVDTFDIQTGNILQDGGVVNFNNKSYEQYYGVNLAPGTELSFTVNKAKASASKENRVAAGYNVKLHPQGHVKLFTAEPLSYTNPHIWAAYLFIMIGLAITAAILWHKSRFGFVGETEKGSSEDDDELFLRLKAKQDLLLERIKSLDAQLENEEIDEIEYQKTREVVKGLLVGVKIQLKELSS